MFDVTNTRSRTAISAEAEENFQASLDGMANEEINAKWQNFMIPYFEGIDEAKADESMIELEEVFHLD